MRLGRTSLDVAVAFPAPLHRELAPSGVSPYACRPSLLGNPRLWRGGSRSLTASAGSPVLIKLSILPVPSLVSREALFR